MSHLSSEKLGTDKLNTRLENGEVMKLFSVSGVAENGAKPEPASPTFYIIPLSRKVKLWMWVLSIFVILILILVVALTVVVSLLYKPWCSDGWISYQQKCYYFSEAEGNWDSSRSQCSALGASLAGIDSLPELAFLMRYKGPNSHWIGLRREGERQPWKWANGAEFNNLFPVTEGADCAYLDSAQVSSSNCQTMKNWICSKIRWS